MSKKYSVILSVLFLLFTNYAYNQNDLLHKKISIDIKNQPLPQVLDIISKKYDINFSYSNKLITDDIIVSIKEKKKTLQYVFDKMLKNHNIDYMVIENNIVFKKTEAKQEPSVKPKKNKYTVSGYLKDKATGELMISTSVYVKELHAGTITNSYGFYSLTLPEGEYNLIFSFIGYNDVIVPIKLNKDLHISQSLEFNDEFLSEVLVKANEDTDFLTGSQLSEVKMNAESFKTIPSFMGETEVVKSLQLLPGIKSYGDGSTFFYVRGGERDQNQILIDEAPVYNPTHLLGFFSSFVPEAIKDVKIYKGDFPANYGNRLSSVIDIKTKDGNMNTISGNAGFGLFMSRFSLEGPIKKQKSSFFVSYRRSNLKWLFNKKTNQNLYFYDFNFKFNIRISQKDRIFFSGYSGKDNYTTIGLEKNNFGLKWKNGASTLRWNHLFNEKLFSNITLTASNYDYFLVISEQNNEYWNSKIANLSLKSDFTYYQTPELTIKFGISFTAHEFIPGKLHLNDNQIRASYPVINPKNAGETVLYLTNQQKINNKINISYGGRLSAWRNIGQATEYVFNENYLPIDTFTYDKAVVYHKYLNLDPKINLNLKLNSTNSLKFGINKTSQYLQLLSNSISPFTSLEVWVPSGPNIKPQKALQYSAGYYKKVKKYNFNFALEGFYKTMKNQIDYKDHANMLLNPLIEGELRFGTAKAYGMEIMINRTFGKLTGITSYTYSRIFKKIKDINNNEPFPAFQDRPHSFSLNVSYKLSKAWTCSANWLYSSGSAISVPTAFYYYNGYSLPVYGQKNNGRLPDYHRLDIMIKLNLNPDHKGSFKHCLVFTLYNAYWNKNYISVNYNQVELENGTFTVPGNMLNSGEYVPTSIYLLGTIPSISYSLEF